MITRSRQVALALTAVLTAGAACQAHGNEPPQDRAAPAPGNGSGAFTLVASGGIRPHDSVIERARFDAGGGGHDFGPMLAGTAPVVARADLALCHLGGALPEAAAGLAATGYDGCSTAFDHGPDDGADGIRRTLDALDRAGVRHAGSARTAQEAGTVTVLRAGRAGVAHLAYACGEHPVDAERILADAAEARRAGADVVVVSLHWGAEWQEIPDERQRSLARALTAARTGGRPAVDLILGTHSRVPQPYEKVNGTWVVYGTGDQAAGEPANDAGVPDPRGNQSTIGRFTFTPPARPGGRWTVTRAEFVPQLFDVDAGRVVNLNRALAQGAEVRAVRDRIREVVLGRGAAKDGLRMGE